MKIVTNERNPASLRLFIAANLAKKLVFCENVPISDKSQSASSKLPVLVLDSGLTLHSVNQAARFLLPPAKAVETKLDQWLEWDSVHLQPTIISCITSPGKYDSRLHSLLAVLDAGLNNSELLPSSKGEVNVASVCLWVSLFPLAADPALSATWIQKYINIHSWWSKLKTIAAFESALKKYNAAAGSEGVQNLASTSWHAVHVYCQQQNAPIADNLTVKEKRDRKGKGDTKMLVECVENGLNKLNVSASPTNEGPEWEAELETSRTNWVKGLQLKPKEHKAPVLPVFGEKNILITSALPYVNNVPHLGNIIGCVLSGDVFARYCRLRNYNTLYLSGTDEYGTATEAKAMEEGLTPQQICDKYHAIHQDIYKWFNIDFDIFSRTTIREQTELTQAMFLRLYNTGYILTESMEQLLCEKCDRYLADRFVEGTCPKCSYDDARGDQCDGCGNLINATELIKPRCKQCGHTPVVRNSNQFFLDLPKIEPKLRDWVENTCSAWTHNARVITKSWLKEGLHPRCITRDLKWGIPVPLEGYDKKVFYVWFDAPIGYMSMTKKYTSKWEQWWQPKENAPVSLFQFMAKDNVPFHSIMFPATLIGADKGYTTVSGIYATEYLNYEDGKFSKSRGTGVFGDNARDTGIPADLWRFYLLFVRPESQDSSFCWDDLALRINTELLNNLGNFVNRALMFVEKNFNSIIPEIHLEKDDVVVIALVNREVRSYINCLEKAKLRDGIRHILSVSRHGNQYIQSQQPWVKAKGSPEDKKRASTVVGLAANLACLISVLLHPYMPQVSKTMQLQLNAPEVVNVITEKFVVLLKPGHRIGKPSPLFSKIEASEAEQLKKKFAGKQRTPPPEGKLQPTSGITDNYKTAPEIQAALDKQASLVREMKAANKSKDEWQPEVAILLRLKTMLATAQKAEAAAVSSSDSSTEKLSVAELEEAIKQQGDIVRTLKASGKSKAEVQPEVTKLLDLKSKLSSMQPLSPSSTTAENSSSSGSGKSKNKKKK